LKAVSTVFLELSPKYSYASPNFINHQQSFEYL